jgi:hypothetical protein
VSDSKRNPELKITHNNLPCPTQIKYYYTTLPLLSMSLQDTQDANDTTRLCIICHDPVDSGIEQTRNSLCKHPDAYYHTPCLDSWLLRKMECPLCRAQWQKPAKAKWSVLFGLFPSTPMLYDCEDLPTIDTLCNWCVERWTRDDDDDDYYELYSIAKERIKKNGIQLTICRVNKGLVAMENFDELVQLTCNEMTAGGSHGGRIVCFGDGKLP